MSATGAAAFHFKDALSAIKHIEAAKTSASMFGIGDAETVYKQLARLCHPDVLAKETTATQKRGNDAFAKLSQMYASLNGKGVSSSPVVFGKWIVEHPIVGGDIADIYQVTSADIKRGVMKIARSAGDNDLMDREVTSLKKLATDTRSDKYKHYVPSIIDTFKASHRRATIINPAEAPLRDGTIEPMISLSDILGMTGGKLDMRHVVWMSNRLLAALGFVHKNGIVHGAIVPPHLMYGPGSHNMLLVDWCYSVSAENVTNVPALVKDYRAWYPREVLRKDKPTPGTDIYMWAYMVRQIADKVPARFKGLLDWCLADSARTRPQDAWEVQDKWGALAQEEFGKPKYLKLNLPIT